MKTLPKQVWLLAATYALMLSGASVIILTAGIVGTRIAPSPGLATLPVALAILGVASMTLPVGLLMARLGRKRVFLIFAGVAASGALLASWSLSIQSFSWFCVSTFWIGSTGAAAQQYRFAAIDCVSGDQIPKAASAVLMGGIVSALIGPEVALLGKDFFSTEFTGSFVLLAGVFVSGGLVLLSLKDSRLKQQEAGHDSRPVLRILRQPVVIAAIAASAIGFGVMSLVMTATPISMHNHYGLGITDTKRVIQSHIAGMYLPSLASGWLIGRFGFQRMMSVGLTAYLLCLGIAYAAPGLFNFWLALVLLGVGWNFLFVSGTSLLPRGYAPGERFKVQSTNDFLVFSVQATGSLSSGWFLYHWGWEGVILTCLPAVGLLAIILLLTRPDSRRPFPVNG